MRSSMSKRTRALDSYFGSPPSKKQITKLEFIATDKADTIEPNETKKFPSHSSYPFALPDLPEELAETLNFVPATDGKVINDQPHLDLVYYQPYIPKEAHRPLFEFLRSELFFYRVTYHIKRGSFETQINTPRWTTVFGLDETSRFEAGKIVDASSGKEVANNVYKCIPRPLPQCLDHLRSLTENVTGCKYNFALVNYYATGDDSISYHSDDERFLGIDPAIASFSLGAKRDFLIKHKPTMSKHPSETQPMKFPLNSGDMILMRGTTQSNWLHSIPKRKGGESASGRINITFRRAMVKGGTENYYRYNVGDGPVYKWNAARREMMLWKG